MDNKYLPQTRDAPNKAQSPRRYSGEPKNILLIYCTRYSSGDDSVNIIGFTLTT